jgi:RNA polymerase sigma factor (sigma-70 family)
MTPATSSTVDTTDFSDADLIRLTRSGDNDAFGHLYSRHLRSARAAAGGLTRSRSDVDDIVGEAFSRILATIQRGGGPQSSFRPYLLTTVRNTFYDRSRRSRREDVTADIDDVVNLTLLDEAGSTEDRALVATAFASLPERWQSVLWHTVVEGRTAAEVAPTLGLAPNAVAALAYRARDGLRAAYLQAHLQNPMEMSCRDCANNLGRYVRDTLSTRERVSVEQHLQACGRCRELLAELEDVNNRLAAVLVPALLGISSAAYLDRLRPRGHRAWVRRARRMRSHAVRHPALTGGLAASAMAGMILIGSLTTASSQGPELGGAAPVTASAAPAERTSSGSTLSPASTATSPSESDPEPSSSESPSSSTQSDPAGSTSASTDAGATAESVAGLTGDAVGGDETVGDDTTGDGLAETSAGTGSGTGSRSSSRGRSPAGTAPAGSSRSGSAATGADPADGTSPSTRTPTGPPSARPSSARPLTPGSATGTAGPIVASHPVPLPSSSGPATSEPATPSTPSTPGTTKGTTPGTTGPTTTGPPVGPTTTTPGTGPTTTTTPTQPPVIVATLDIGAQLVAPALAGGEVLVRIDIANGSSGGGGSIRPVPTRTAANVVITMALPRGVTFRASSNPGWTCTARPAATLSCRLATLGAAARQSSQLVLQVAEGVRQFSLRPSASATGVPERPAATPLVVDVGAVTGALFSGYDTGTVIATGSSSMTCDESMSLLCGAARDGIGVALNRQDFALRHVLEAPLSDAAATAFNASSATLQLGGSSVVRAYLVWGGDTGATDPGDGATTVAPDADAFDTVRLTVPSGGEHAVRADTARRYDDGSRYTATADVTQLVRASGEYQVADIQAATGIDSFAGWSLIVVTHDPTAPMRLLTVVAPDASIDDTQGYELSVPLAPGSSPRAAVLASVAFEGELGFVPESLTMNGSPLLNASSPAGNQFNSAVEGALHPVRNSFGVDVGTFHTEVTGPEARVAATSQWDYVRLGLFALSIDV